MHQGHDKRSFLVWTCIHCQCIKEVNRKFGIRFPRTPVLSTSTIQRNIIKFKKEGIKCLNLNKKYSGRPKSGTSRKNVKIVREHLRIHPKSSSS